jgi:DNA adenine methylase
MRKPFLKWAGGKTKVLPHILPLIGNAEHFIEPFAGSMSVGLNVPAKVCILNDINGHIIQLYQQLIGEGEEFINYCESFFIEGNISDTYYERRTLFNETDDSRERSALFVYLNRYGFNGLTRYNKSGGFNVPFGKYKKPYFPRNEMVEFRNAMQRKMLLRMTSFDFSDPLLYQNLSENSVVYCDPPYIPLNETSNFTAYSTDGFSNHDQIRLKQLALNLCKQGAKVIISNHDVPAARELYVDATKIIEISVNRSVSAKGGSRGKVGEILAVYQP